MPRWNSFTAAWQVLRLLVLMPLFFSTAGHAKELKPWLYWNNYIEFQTYTAQYDDNEYDSDALFTTVSSGLDVYYKKLSAHVYGIYRENETDPPELERVQFAWAPTSWMTWSIGQNYLPFSYIDTLSVSYAPTASLGLTFRENITLSLHSTHFYFAAYTYKTHLKYWDLDAEAGATDDPLDHWGVDFSISPTQAFTMGGSLMSNLGDSDLFAAVFPDAEYMTEKVPVAAAYFSLFWKRLGLIVEAIEATERFNDIEFYGYLDGLRPRATNAEMALYKSPTSWGLIGYRTTHQAAFTGLAAESFVAGYTNTYYNKQVSIAFELRLLKSYANEFTDGKRLTTTGAGVKFTFAF